MSKLAVKIEHTPRFREYKMSGPGIRSLLAVTGAEIHVWDGQLWYVSLEDWGRVFRDVLLNMPAFTDQRFDCEDFAILVTARVLERYKLNTCGIAVGCSPFGEHGYNLFIADVDGEARLFILEPQNGIVYPVEEPEGYRPRIVIMG